MEMECRASRGPLTTRCPPPSLSKKSIVLYGSIRTFSSPDSLRVESRLRIEAINHLRSPSTGRAGLPEASDE